MVDLTTVKKWIAENKWTFAKTMPKNPHEYTLRNKWKDKKDFDKFVMYIRQHGKLVTFGRTRFIIVVIDGYRYWCMNGRDMWVLINRAVEK